MAKFAILRTAKLKSFGNIGASLAHNYRTRPTPNADPSKSEKNIHAFRGKAATGKHPAPEAVLEAIKARLPEQRRSDAVLCVEYLITCSPDALDSEKRHLEYLDDAKRWLENKHGKENVIAASVHLDETTPHLVAYVVPLDKKQTLNCKAFLGGKAKLNALQSDFAKKVGAKYGLERGVEGSTADHVSIKKFYGLIAKALEPIEIPAGELEPREKSRRFGLIPVVETPDDVEKRVNALVDELQKPLLAKAKLTDLAESKIAKIRKKMLGLESRLAEAEKRAAVAEERAAAARKREREVTAAFTALTPAQQSKVEQVARENTAIRSRAANFLSDAYSTATGGMARLAHRVKDALSSEKGAWWQVPWANLEKEFRSGEQRCGSSLLETETLLNDHFPPRATWSSEQKSKATEEALRAEVERKRALALEEQKKAQERALEQRERERADEARVRMQSQHTVASRPRPK